MEGRNWWAPPQHSYGQSHCTLKEGILRGVFKQKAARAWFGCRAEKAQVTVLLPGSCSLSEWSGKVDYMPHSWPKSFNIGKMQMGPVQANTFHLHRICILSGQGYIATRKSMTDCLPTLAGMTISRILSHSPAHWRWFGQRDHVWQLVDARVAPVVVTMEKTLAEYRANLQVEQAEIAKHSAVRGKKKWKTKDGIYIN